MSLLNILQFPDPRLKLVAKPVTEFNDEIKRIVDDMFETMYEAQGVGLAAIQVNLQQRIFTMDISSNSSSPLAIINPKIIEREGEIIWEEGCLSFPGVYAKVKRSAKIKLEYYDVAGQIQHLDAEDLTSVCIQHEIDHLDGITFYDHLSKVKQQMLREKLKKIREKSL